MPSNSPLDELLSLNNSVGEVTQQATYGADAPLPAETPAETDKRAVQQFAQRQSLNRRRGADLAARDIPAYLDEKGDVQAVTDPTGAALTSFDSRSNVGYDSTGAPKKITYGETGAPKLSDPYEGATPWTDPKTGDKYARVPGMPWKHLGKDEQIAAKAQAAAADKDNAALATTLGRKITLDEHDFKNEQKDWNTERAEITNAVPGLSGVSDRAEAAKIVDAQFTDSAAKAKKTTGWFGRGELTADSKATTDRLEEERQAMQARVASFFDKTDALRAKTEGLKQNRVMAEQLQRERVSLQMRKLGLIDEHTPVTDEEKAAAGAQHAQAVAAASTPVQRPIADVKEEAKQPVTDASAAGTLDKIEQAPVDAFERLGEIFSAPDMNKGKTGFVTLIPFAGTGADIAVLAKLGTAAYRLEHGQETQEDLGLLKDYVDRNKRSSTFGAKVVDVISALPAFAGELAATGGIYTAAGKGTIAAGKLALKKLATEAGEKILEKKIAQFGLKALGSTAGSVAQFLPASGLRVTAGTMERMLPQMDIKPNEAGELEGAITKEGDDFVPAMMKATGDQFVEVWSEHTGGALKFVPGAEKLKLMKAGLMQRWFKANPGATPGAFTKFLKDAGWHGVIGEMFEERVGDVAKGLGAAGMAAANGGTAGETVDSFMNEAIPSPEQLAVEAVSFFIPGAGFHGVGVYRQRQFNQKLGARAVEYQKADSAMAKAIAVLDDPAMSPAEKEQAATMASQIGANHENAAAFVVGQHKSVTEDALDEMGVEDKRTRTAAAEFINEPGAHVFAAQELGASLIHGGEYSKEAKALDQQLRDNGVDQPERRAAMVNHIVGSTAMAETISQVAHGEPATHKGALDLLRNYGVITRESAPDGTRSYKLDARAIKLLPPSIAKELTKNLSKYQVSNTLDRTVSPGLRQMVTAGRENIRRAAEAIAPWSATDEEADPFADETTPPAPATPATPAPTPATPPTPAPGTPSTPAPDNGNKPPEQSTPAPSDDTDGKPAPDEEKKEPAPPGKTPDAKPAPGNNPPSTEPAKPNSSEPVTRKFKPGDRIREKSTGRVGRVDSDSVDRSGPRYYIVEFDGDSIKTPRTEDEIEPEDGGGGATTPSGDQTPPVAPGSTPESTPPTETPEEKTPENAPKKGDSDTTSEPKGPAPAPAADRDEFDDLDDMLGVNTGNAKGASDDESSAAESTDALVARTKVGPERESAFARRADAVRRLTASLKRGDVVIDADGGRHTVDSVMRDTIFTQENGGGQYQMVSGDRVERASVDTSAKQAAKNPTDGQKRAGNYQKGHVNLGGLKLSIENPAGSKRRAEWPALASHYGYIRGSTGRDKDHIDVFIRPGTPQDYHGPVFVVNQDNADGTFDEHKAVIGASSAADALAEYNSNYEAGWNRAGSVAEFKSMDAFRRWATGAVRRTAPARGVQIHPGGATSRYANVPDSLMGFRRSGQNTPFADSKYPHIQPVNVTFSDGASMVDAVKGMNKEHAMERARRNWPGASIREATQEQLDEAMKPGATPDSERMGIGGQPESAPKPPADLTTPESISKLIAVAKKLVELGHNTPREFTETLLSKLKRNADKVDASLMSKLWSFAQDHADLPDATRGDFAKILQELRGETAPAPEPAPKQDEAPTTTPPPEAPEPAPAPEEEKPTEETPPEKKTPEEPPEAPKAPEPEQEGQFPGPSERKGRSTTDAAWRAEIAEEFAAQMADYERMGKTLGFTVKDAEDGGAYFKPSDPDAIYISSELIDSAMKYDHGISWIRFAFSEEFTHMLEFWAGDKDAAKVERNAEEIFREMQRLNPMEAQAIYERYDGRASHAYMGHEYIRMVWQARDTARFTDLFRTPYAQTQHGHNALTRVFKKIVDWMRRLFAGGELKRQFMLEEKLAQMEKAMQPDVTKWKAPKSGTDLAERVKSLLIVGTKINRHYLKQLGQDAGLTPKQVDEFAELGIVRAAQIVANHTTLSPMERYRRLVEIYRNQPNLSEQTGRSRELQAYSTPVPLAYFASRLAGVQDSHYIGEPTAGNGALLIEADPRRLVRVNELDPERADRLRYLGFEPRVKSVLEGDIFSSRDIEALVANPPFGSFKENGIPTGKAFNITVGGYDYSTTRIDYYIALKALEDGLRDGGKAVLIIGGVNEQMRERQDGYKNTAALDFWSTLSLNYNVTDLLTVSGDLYEKQGAGWPVDVIVIEGRGKSKKFTLPSAVPPRIVKTWEDLGNLLNAHENPRPNQSPSKSPGSGKSGRDDSIPPVAPVPERKPSGDDSGGGRGKPESEAPKPDGSTAPGSERPDSEGGTGQQPADSDSTGKSDGSKPSDGGLVGSEHQVPYIPASSSREPDGMLTPTNLAQPQQDALARMKDEVGDIDDFVVERLGFASKEEMGKHLMAEQVDGLALGIWNHERGHAMIVGDQTGIGKGRVAAGMIRYALKSGMTPIFVTKDDGLYMDMFRDLAGIGTYTAEDPWANIRPIFTNREFRNNSGTKGVLEDIHGTKWRLVPGQQKKLIEKIVETGEMPAWQDPDGSVSKTLKSNAIFTTYSQLQGDAAGERAAALQAIAPNAFLVIDESHLGAGQSSRFERLSKIQAETKGVYYSSATYCKRSEAIALYSRTSISATGIPVEDLVDIMEHGKQPLQQVVAAMLSIDGCYIRRERDFRGIKFRTVVTKEAKAKEREFEMAGNFIELARGVLETDRVMGKGMASLTKAMAEAGLQFRESPNSRPQRVKMASRNPFANSFYMLSQQYTMAMKAKAVAEQAIDRVKNGGPPLTPEEKARQAELEAMRQRRPEEQVELQTLIDSQKPQQVVIALTFTNESPLKQIAGGNMDLTFNSLLKRYLTNVGQVRMSVPGAIAGALATSMQGRELSPEEDQILKDLTGDVPQIRWNMLEDDFPAVALRAMQLMGGDAAKIGAVKAMAESIKKQVREKFIKTNDMVEGADLGDMPLSPIDYIRDRLEEAGITAGDYTGRNLIVKEKRLVPKKEEDEQGKKEIERKFQDGELDVIILNASGSTGISLHSSKTEAKSHKQRVMILAQPNAEINEFMQTLGRINRTGQVNKPEYIFQRSSLPAETRLAVFLMKKMNSLNANTTSATDSDLTSEMDVADIFNQFGDASVQRWLRANAGDAVDNLFWIFEPYRYDKDGMARSSGEQVESFILAFSGEDGKLVSKITGAMAAVNPEVAEEFYENVTEEYRSLIAAATAAGENPFVSEAFDYQATTVSSVPIFEGAKTGSIFAEDARLEKIQLKNVQEPITIQEAAARAKENIGRIFLPHGRPSKTRAMPVIPRPAIPGIDTPETEIHEPGSYTPSDWKLFEGAIDNELKKQLDNRRNSDEFKDNRGAWLMWAAGRENHWKNIKDRAMAQVRRIGEKVIVEVGGVMTQGIIIDARLNFQRPGALSSSEMVIAVNTTSRKGIIRIPLSSAAEKIHNYDATHAEHSFGGPFYLDWEKTKRILNHRYVITGNILGGYRALQERDQLQGASVITYTTDDGKTATAIQMPEKFAGFQETLIRTGGDLVSAVLYGHRVATVSPVEGIIHNDGGYLKLLVPSTNKGNPVSQNKRIIAMSVGGDFATTRYNGKKYLGVEITPAYADELVDELTKLGMTLRVPEANNASDVRRAVKEEVATLQEAAAAPDELPADERRDATDPIQGVSTYPGATIGDNVDNAESAFDEEGALGDMPVEISSTPTATFKGKKVSRPQAINAMLQIFKAAGRDVRIRVGRIRGRKDVTGVWKDFPEIIRTRKAFDVGVAAHEVGHGMQKVLYSTIKASALRSLPKTVKAELLKLGHALYGNRTPHTSYTTEGFAEFIRIYLTQDNAKVIAPATYDYLLNTVMPMFPNVRDAFADAKGVIDQYRSQGSVNAADANIVNPVDWRIRLENFRRMFTKGEIMRNWVDEVEPIRQLVANLRERHGVTLPIDEDPEKLYKVRRGQAAGIAHYIANEGMLDLAGNKVGGGLREALAPVADAMGNFRLYLYAHRALERWEQGKDPGIEKKVAQDVVDELGKDPRFQIAAEAVWEWNRGLLNYVGQASPSLRPVVERIMQNSQKYIPLMRWFDEGEVKPGEKAGGSGGNALAAMRGSGRQIVEPFPAMLQQAQKLLEFAHKRQILDAVIAIGNGFDSMGFQIEEVPRDKIAHDLKLGDIAKQLEDLGIELDGADEDAVLTFFSPALAPKGKDPIIAHVVNGKTRWYQVDPRLFGALEGVDLYRFPKALDILLGGPARLFRLGTTGLRASFGLFTNPARDLPTFLMQTRSERNPARLLAEWAQSMAALVNPARIAGHKSKWIDLFERTGVQVGQPLGADIAQATSSHAEMHHGMMKRIVHHPLDMLRELFSLTESAPRIAELKLVAEQVGWDGTSPLTQAQMLEIALAAKEVTLDFSAAGAIGKKINQAIPFFNATIRGTVQAYEAYRRNPLRFVLRGLTWTTIPAVMLWLLNRDDDWYNDLPWRDRYLYFNIRFGNKIVQIPRSPEIGNYFGVVPEAILDAWHDRDPEGAIEAAKHIVATHNPIDLPPAFRMMKEQYQNRIDFFDRPIVPKAEEDLLPGEQRGGYTSKIAKVLGDTFPETVSPRRVDAAIRSMTGGAFTDLIGGGENLLKALGVMKQDTEFTASDLPVVGRAFRRGGVDSPISKSVTEFYDNWEEAQRRQKSIMRPETEADRRRRLQLDDAKKAIQVLTIARSAAKTTDQAGTLTRRIREIAQEAVRNAPEASTPPKRTYAEAQAHPATKLTGKVERPQPYKSLIDDARQKQKAKRSTDLPTFTGF